MEAATASCSAAWPALSCTASGSTASPTAPSLQKNWKNYVRSVFYILLFQIREQWYQQRLLGAHRPPAWPRLPLPVFLPPPSLLMPAKPQNSCILKISKSKFSKLQFQIFRFTHSGAAAASWTGWGCSTASGCAAASCTAGADSRTASSTDSATASTAGSPVSPPSPHQEKSDMKN